MTVILLFHSSFRIRGRYGDSTTRNIVSEGVPLWLSFSEWGRLFILPNAAHCEAALMRSMREPQCLMQCYCTVLDNQVWQCVHEGWSTETGDVSGIIDQDRNWPNWQFEVRLKPSWLSWKVYCCCNDVIPSLVEIVESYKSEEAQVSLVELGRQLALPSRWMLVVSVPWRLPYCVLVQFMFQFCFTRALLLSEIKWVWVSKIECPWVPAPLWEWLVSTVVWNRIWTFYINPVSELYRICPILLECRFGESKKLASPRWLVLSILLMSVVGSVIAILHVFQNLLGV